MTCRYHQGKDRNCGDCAVSRVESVYSKWYQMSEGYEELLSDLRSAIDGPPRKPKTKKKIKDDS